MASGGRRSIHLVGTVPLDSTEAVFDVLADTIAPDMRRIPDGETGPRSYWVSSQARVLHDDPKFEPAGHDWAPGKPMPEAEPPMYRPRRGVDPASISVPSFGYGDFARESYAVFKEAQRCGRLPAEARFQVGLPTPLGFYSAIVAYDCQEALADAFSRRMTQELEDVLAVVPHDELAIQWDSPLEIYIWEGIRPTHHENPREWVLEELTRLGNLVPQPVELGYHLCYGDYQGKHGVEPADTTHMVTIANAVVERVRRPVDWFHMPVPRDRDDDAYYAPLTGLKLDQGCELYLGLVHDSDGEEGTLRRMATADRHFAGYGISAVCGLGRPDPATIPATLGLHRSCAGHVMA